MENQNHNDPFLFYFYLHSNIKDLSKSKLVSKKEINSFLHHWRIPSSLRPLICKELELLGMVECIGRWDYKILDLDYIKLKNHLMNLGHNNPGSLLTTTNKKIF